ncbi:unnamed protein product [Pedinophyceae sp. YPF-701]|nr:unnamed protein product [Pedinophyceae sp. YPF-701]
MAALLGPAAAPSSRAPLQRAAASSSALDPHVGAQAASYPPRPPPASGGSPLRHTGGRGARSAAAPSRDPSPPPRRSSNIVADSAAYFELSESDSEAEARAVAAVQGRPGGNSRVSTGPVAPAGSVGGNTGSTADATDRLRALELKESLLSQAIEELEQEAHSVTEPLEAIEEEDPALLSGRGLNTTVDPKSAPCLTDQAQLLRQAVTEAIGDDGFRRLYGSVRDAVSGRVPGDTQAFAQQLPPQQRPLLALVDKLVYIEDVMSGRAA